MKAIIVLTCERCIDKVGSRKMTATAPIKSSREETHTKGDVSSFSMLLLCCPGIEADEVNCGEQEEEEYKYTQEEKIEEEEKGRKKEEEC